MKNRRIQACAVLFPVLSFLLPNAANSAPKPAGGEFVWLSDIHFDPLADRTLVDKLAAAEPTQWESVLAGSSRKFSSFGQDANWPLFSSAVHEIRKVVPDPAFTIVTGDLIAHHFRTRFNESASVHDDAAFRSFARKTLEFVALQLKTIAPAKPVFISLGNNDSDCGDYALQPDSEFLRGTLSSLADLLKVPDGALSGWAQYGAYNVPHPFLRQGRIISVNTVLFSGRYRNTCGSASDDPGAKLISWLEAELAKAKGNHEKVWLIYHIPPGIDGFATTRHEGQAVPFWKEQYADGFDRLLTHYHDTIAASFAGHTHTDDFRLVDGSTPHRSLVLMTPALSPYVKQNPAFRVVQFQKNGTLTDQVTYYLSNLEAAGGAAEAEWKREYSFRQEWGVRKLDYGNFEKLYRRIDASPEARERWSFLYSVSHPEGGSITPRSFWALHCASGHSDIDKYQACLSAHQ